MTSQSGNAADRLQAAIAAAALPPAVVTAWNEPAPDVEAGQLWRAAWQDAAEMVFITAVSDGQVMAAPVTVDSDFADEHTAVLPPEATSAGVALAVWAGLTRQLPMFVLDRLVGRAAEGWSTPDVLTAARERGALNGTPLVDAVDRRHEYRAQLQDALEVLATASWAPAGSGTLGTLLRGAGVKAEQVAQSLHATPQEALALLRNELPVTSEQARALAALAGTSEAELLDANPAPPVDLVAQLDQPRRRRQVQALASRRGTDELTARRTAVFESWRFAARQTGAPSTPAWDERLDQYFSATLDG